MASYIDDEDDDNDSPFDESALFAAAMRRFDEQMLPEAVDRDDDADDNDAADDTADDAPSDHVSFELLQPISHGPQDDADADDDFDDDDDDDVAGADVRASRGEYGAVDALLVQDDAVAASGTADLDELESFLDQLIVAKKESLADDDNTNDDDDDDGDAIQAFAAPDLPGPPLSQPFAAPALPPPPRSLPPSLSLKKQGDGDATAAPAVAAAPEVAIESAFKGRGVSKAARFGNRPELCQLCNENKAKAIVKRKGVSIWMCKPCANETNDTFAAAGTIGIDVLAQVATLDPAGVTSLPVPPEWTATIDYRTLPTLPSVPTPEQPTAAESAETPTVAATTEAPPPLPEERLSDSDDADDESNSEQPAVEQAAPQVDQQAPSVERVEEQVPVEQAAPLEKDDPPPAEQPRHVDQTPAEEQPIEQAAKSPDLDAPPPFSDAFSTLAAPEKTTTTTTTTTSDDAPPPFDASHAPAPKCTVCTKRPARHRATSKSGQIVLLCAKCLGAIRRKKELTAERAVAVAKPAIATPVAPTATVSLSRATKADLQAMAKATAAGDMTLKRAKVRVCQRCERPGNLSKATIGSRLVILCSGCVEDVRSHLSAREQQRPGAPASVKVVSARDNGGLCERCNAATATRSVPGKDGASGPLRFCAPCSTKVTLAKR